MTTVALMRFRAARACSAVGTDANLICVCGVVRTGADLARARTVVGTAAAEDVASDALVAEAECAEPHPASVSAAADSASAAQPQPDRNRPGRARAAVVVTASGRFLSVRAWMTAT
jgi:hypothetical protein